MRLCERNNWIKPCPNICGEMCEVWNTEECRFSESKRGWSCEQCWTHSIPDSEIVGDDCPVCGTSEFLGQPDDRFNVGAWCGGTGTRWTPDIVKPATNAGEILIAYLEANRFDGLYVPGGHCSCEPDDLMPCDCAPSACVPGVKIPCDGDHCDGDCKFHIGPRATGVRS